MSEQMTPEQLNLWAAKQDGRTNIHIDRDDEYLLSIPDYYHDANEAMAFAGRHGFTWFVQSIHGGKIKYSYAMNIELKTLGSGLHEVPAAAIMLAVHAAMTEGK